MATGKYRSEIPARLSQRREIIESHSPALHKSEILVQAKRAAEGRDVAAREREEREAGVLGDDRGARRGGCGRADVRGGRGRGDGRGGGRGRAGGRGGRMAPPSETRVQFAKEVMREFGKEVASGKPEGTPDDEWYDAPQPYTVIYTRDYRLYYDNSSSYYLNGDARCVTRWVWRVLYSACMAFTF